MTTHADACKITIICKSKVFFKFPEMFLFLVSCVAYLVEKLYRFLFKMQKYNKYSNREYILFMDLLNLKCYALDKQSQSLISNVNSEHYVCIHRPSPIAVML